ncbi:restriction endonuclease subunit S [Saccharopolyspora pogona]|uniref:restriction endonuclease subunit S n=1 Tax=Saccharopolyspora pogona TaxID=333966 RepID=UPI001689B49E|nr:restriction endonuclease subunit S [Saccharopolyspora pogona]
MITDAAANPATTKSSAANRGNENAPGGMRKNHYLLHYLAAEWAQDWMDKHCSRTTIPSLSAKTMRQLPVWLPPLDQQEAIIEIMSSLDEQLALKDEVADTTERLKHYLGQLIGAGDFPLRD